MPHRRQQKRQRNPDLVDRTVYIAKHAPTFPEPDATPGIAWEWCDRCNGWVKAYAVIPAFIEEQTGTVLRKRQLVCACCAYGKTAGPLGPELERCLQRSTCPATCPATEIQDELRRLAGITDTTEARTAQPIDLTVARATWIRRAGTAIRR